jgi:ribosomal protein L40E
VAGNKPDARGIGGDRTYSRTSAGRFSRAPSLGATVCGKCRSINLPHYEGEPFPEKVQPKVCHACGAPLTDE